MLWWRQPRICCSENKVAAAPVDDDEPAQMDYPRPAPPGERAAHEHRQHEEEQPRKEKRNAVPDATAKHWPCAGSLANSDWLNRKSPSQVIND